MSDVKQAGNPVLPVSEHQTSCLCRDIAGEGKISKNRAIARARGHFKRKEGQTRRKLAWRTRIFQLGSSQRPTAENKMI